MLSLRQGDTDLKRGEASLSIPSQIELYFPSCAQIEMVDAGRVVSIKIE